MRQKLVEFVLFIGVWVVSDVTGGRILFHMPTPNYSHNAVYTPIIREMARRGHHVVSITTRPIPPTEDLTNITQIDVSFVTKNWDKHFEEGMKLNVLQQLEKYQQVNKLIISVIVCCCPFRNKLKLFFKTSANS